MIKRLEIGWFSIDDLRKYFLQQIYLPTIMKGETYVDPNMNSALEEGNQIEYLYIQDVYLDSDNVWIARVLHSLLPLNNKCKCGKKSFVTEWTANYLSKITVKVK